MRDVMADIETLGVRPGSVILSIGAVRFDRDTGEISPNVFYRVIDRASCHAAGLTEDASTVDWWTSQSEEARAVLRWADAGDAAFLPDALQDFADWMAAGPSPRLWGCGAAFNNVLLRAAFDAVGLPHPWPFWNDRCFRTLKGLHPGREPERQGVYHNALDDALHQARWALAILSPARTPLGTGWRTLLCLGVAALAVAALLTVGRA